MPPKTANASSSSTASLPTSYSGRLAVLSYVLRDQGLDPLDDDTWVALDYASGAQNANVGLCFLTIVS